MTALQLFFWLFAALACMGAIAVVISQNVVRMAFWLIVSLGSVAALFFLLHADFVAATQLLVYVGGTVVLLIFGVMLTASGPFLRIRTSPAEGFLAAGIGSLFLAMLVSTVAAVDWTATSLKLTEIPRERFEEIRREEDLPAEHAELLDEWYVLVEEAEPPVYRLRRDEAVPSEAATRLTRLWESERVARRAPGPEDRGTIRSIGLALHGTRPDKDLGAPEKRALSTGYLLPFEIVSIHLLVVLIGAAYLARAKRRVEPTENQ